MNIENKAAYPKEKSTSNYNDNYPNMNGGFEITIRTHSSQKFGIIVTKSMTVKELKEKIIKEHKANFPKEFELAFKRPLRNTETLEFYGITKPVTLVLISTFVG